MIMRILAATLLLLASSPDQATREIQIVYRRDQDRQSIPEQVRKGFVEMLDRDKALKSEFAALQTSARERAGGRYSLGRAETLVLPRFESVDFTDMGGTARFAETVVLYFPFIEGEHRGMTVADGTFACFAVHGIVNYGFSHGKHSVTQAAVTATFEGFHKELKAEPGDRGERDNP